MKIVRLKEALEEKKYKVVDLYERVNLKYEVSYAKISAYCRAIDPSRYHDANLHRVIAETITDMGIEWSLPLKCG